MPTPTQKTVAEYFAAIRSQDAERCAALFAPEAEQQDPVGTPANIGQPAILAFFQGLFKAFQSVSLTEDAVYANGTSAAAKWSGKVVAPNGKSVTFEGVDVIDCNEAGKIILVRAFWDAAPVMALLND